MIIMSRPGIRVSLFRYVYPKYSVIILVNKLCYYHPYKTWHWFGEYVAVFNKFVFADVRFKTDRGFGSVRITYKNKHRKITLFQESSLKIIGRYIEKWGEQHSCVLNLEENRISSLDEITYLCRNLYGNLFERYHVILRIIEKINMTDELRDKLYALQFG